MPTRHEGDVLVLSADPDRPRRLIRLCHERGAVGVTHLSDPAELARALRAATGSADAPQSSNRPLGVILDLTSPSTEEGHRIRRLEEAWATIRAVQEAEIAWCIAALIAAVQAAPGLPLLVVSGNAHLDPVLAQTGLPLVARVPPDAEDSAWRLALARFFAVGDRHRQGLRMVATGGDAGGYGPGGGEASDLAKRGVVWLRGDLQFDLDGCALLEGERSVPLTAREVALLTTLSRVPGRFCRAGELARQLGLPATGELDGHSIEQAISGLRRKLGETAQRPRVLQSRRGLGYALFPDESS